MSRGALPAAALVVASVAALSKAGSRPVGLPCAHENMDKLSLLGPRAERRLRHAGEAEGRHPESGHTAGADASVREGRQHPDDQSAARGPTGLGIEGPRDRATGSSFCRSRTDLFSVVLPGSAAASSSLPYLCGVGAAHACELCSAQRAAA